jgi:hypothetical protein
LPRELIFASKSSEGRNCCFLAACAPVPWLLAGHPDGLVKVKVC